MNILKLFARSRPTNKVDKESKSNKYLCLICEKEKISIRENEPAYYMKMVCDDCRMKLQKLIKITS